MKIVVALGGNALLQRGEPPTAEIQRGHAREAMAAVAELAREHDVVLTHGNGPQVGLLALQASAYTDVPAVPARRARRRERGDDRLRARAGAREPAARPQRRHRPDPGRRRPPTTRPSRIRPSRSAPVYTEEDARRLAAERGWAIAPDNQHFRRVVASPQPLRIVELDGDPDCSSTRARSSSARAAAASRSTDGDGTLRGVEAVIDKDLAAELLARSLEADFLLMLTDVGAVIAGWGTPDAQPIRRATPAELRAIDFAAGSMGPKVEAACRFVEATGGTAAIGALEDAVEILAGTRRHHDRP